MQSPVKIQKEGRHINVYFSYNEDLVEIMRDMDGWWIYKKMCWMFPASKKSEIIDKLKECKYKVNILPDVDYERKKVEYKYDIKKVFEDEDVTQVWGLCKKCNQKKFINKNCLCTECSVKSH